MELKRIIKDHEATIKSLLRQLKKNDEKPKTKFAEVQSNNYDAEDESICKACNNGKIIETELGKRKMLHCSYCTYRKVVSNG